LSRNTVYNMKKILLLAPALLLLHALRAQTPAPDTSFVALHYTKIERRIPMRDGVRLFTAIYIPKDISDNNRYPFLMERTPYSVAPYGEKALPGDIGPNPWLMREKYIFVYQDVRGRYMSEGQFQEVTPNQKDPKTPDESSDTYDTVEWLLANIAGNNGRVGIAGISYPGFYASAALPDAHPAIRAVSPQAPVTDEFMGDDVNHQGAFFLMDNFMFTNYFDAPRDTPVTDYEPLAKFQVKDTYQFFLDLGPVSRADELYFTGRAKIWKEYLQHDTYDAYWQSRNIRSSLQGIQAATLTVGGWFDAEDLFGALNTYRAIDAASPGSKHYLIMGPWTHGAWSRANWTQYASHDFGQNTARYFQENFETPFFNYFLKDKGAFNQPEVTLFDAGTNEWRSFDHYPPAAQTLKALYLLPDGKLAFERGKAGGFDEYVSDPAKPVPYTNAIMGRRNNEYMAEDQRFAARRPDVLVYQSEPLSEDLTLSGDLLADLYVRTTGTDADFVVKLIDVLPEDTPNPNPNPKGFQMAGMQRLVRAEVIRGKFRDNYTRPKAFAPGKVEKVAYQLPGLTHTFKKGHRIMVQVQSSWFPLVDRNPQRFMRIPEAKAADFQKATIRVYHDAQYPSCVRVPVLGKK
jgi:uncharacterized protein